MGFVASVEKKGCGKGVAKEVFFFWMVFTDRPGFGWGFRRLLSVFIVVESCHEFNVDLIVFVGFVVVESEIWKISNVLQWLRWRKTHQSSCDEIGSVYSDVLKASSSARGKANPIWTPPRNWLILEHLQRTWNLVGTQFFSSKNFSLQGAFSRQYKICFYQKASRAKWVKS